MKTIRHLTLLIITLISIHTASAAVDSFTPPALAEVLKYRPANVVVFSPTRLAATDSFHLTHLAFGDGSAFPTDQRAVMLVVYSSKPDETGKHAILFQDFHFLNKTNDPLLNFTAFVPGTHAPAAVENDNRAGIIAVLIGLLHVPSRGGWIQAPLPAQDSVSALVSPGDGSAGLLLPAVQKIRAAAARL